MDAQQLLAANRAARAAFHQGDYSSVLSIADEAKPEIVRPGPVGTYARNLFNEKARALRNLGRIQEALEVYTETLRGAGAARNELDLAWQLVLFGKLFGKYLDRQSLFSACLREARARLGKMVKNEPGLEPEDEHRLYLRFAILHDLLGSYFRRIARTDKKSRGLCERAHATALEYHTRIGNWEGVARTRCHLGYARALFAKHDEAIDELERKKQLRDGLLMFEAGASMVYRNPEALPGWATRRIQHGELFLMLGNANVALAFVDEGLQAAQRKDDPRAVILGAQVKARALWALGKGPEAAASLEKARELAHDWQYSGFERTIASHLGEIYLNLGDDHRAITCFEDADRLIEKELMEFNTGLGGALDAFREAVPRRAEQYLLEGQQSDYELLVENLRSNARILRDLIARRERTKSVHLQLAIDRFARVSVRHSIRNDLQAIEMAVRRMAQRIRARPEEFQELCEATRKAEEAIRRISHTLGKPRGSERTTPSSLISALVSVSSDFFPAERVRICVSKDAVFPGLAPVILQEALRHLLENAAGAVRNAPPITSEVPLLEVRNEVDENGNEVFLLMNPGTNPTRDLDAPQDGMVLHGFANARLFFEAVFGIKCIFQLRTDGPRTPPYRTNCVLLRLVTNTKYRALWILLHANSNFWQREKGKLPE